MEKPKPNKPKTPSGKPAPAAPTPPAAPIKVAPLFRKMDWLVLIVSFAAIWIAYLWTLAPDLTLEDSGELCTASFYAGIPHPPGYPFWSLYSYLWTLFPFGSVTWRVELGESFAAAMACGLVGLMVSRGSSMLIEGIQELNAISRKWENAICIVCGIVAGLLLGFDDFMWKESVVINRISLFDVPWLMLVAACLMRWIYAPHQRRYLYIAMFFFGLCFTIHQTMLVAAMGIEVAIAMTNTRLGRDLMLGNSFIYIVVCMASAAGMLSAYTSLDPVFKGIFQIVGLASIALCVWLTAKTKSLGTELKIVILAGVFCILGAAFYFYEPLSGMTDPPMQWGYPRTVEGFFHAFTRGQYESAHPTNIFSEKTHFLMQLGLLINGVATSFSWVFLFVALLPFLFIFKMQRRERSWIIGLTAIYFCVGILLAIVMNTTPDRQSAEENKVFFTASHGIVAVMIGYGLALLSAFMATHYTTFRRFGLILGAITIVPVLALLRDSESTTFFGGVGLMEYIEILIFSLCMAAAFVFTALSVHSCLKIKNNPAPDTNVHSHFKIFTAAAICLFFLSVLFAFSSQTFSGIWNNWSDMSFGERFASPAQFLWHGIPEIGRTIVQLCTSLPRIFEPHQYSLPVIGALLLLAALIAFIAAIFAYRNRAPLIITLGLFMVTPLYSALSHWANGEQRNHWFGYWFGHDMFTPPFVGPDGKFSYDPKLREQAMKGKDGNLVYPEMTRNTILFGGTDPGRFCPTYMIFCESFVPPYCKPMDPNFDRRDVYLITQNALADGTYLDYLRAQYFRSAQIDPPFFREFLKLYWWAIFGLAAFLCVIWLGVDFMQNNPQRNRNAIVIGSIWGLILIVVAVQGGVPQAAFNILDKPLTKFGKNVENDRRAEGVYPPKEIYIPLDEDLSQAFRDYSEDAARRKEQGLLQPGEDIQIDDMGRVQASGEVSVMMINGLLCKVIFDHNPTNDFYVEESFPLEWMYPYETPYGIIMKVNREPFMKMPDDAFTRDHAFWSKYSERFIGNWITYDTTVAQITNFVQKVYLDHNYSDFKGDLRFLRDEDAQKAFSKLRDSQAGMYAWRLKLLQPQSQTHEPDEYMVYRPKSDAEIQQLYKEADFAFKQSFAFCPYSPESVIRYVNFLFQFQRFDDALMVAKTCQQLDPYNGQISDLVSQIEDILKQVGAQKQAMSSLDQMETEARDHPTNIPNLMSLGSTYFEMQQTDRAMEVFDHVLTNSATTYSEAFGLAGLYSKLGPNYFDRLESVLKRLTEIAPDEPEARYDLAAIQVVRGETNEALENLRLAMDMNSKRLKKTPTATDLTTTLRADARFDSVRNLPEFQKIAAPQ